MSNWSKKTRFVVGGAFLLLCTFWFYTPLLLKSWQKHLVHDYLLSLGGEWQVAESEESSNTLLFYHPHWSLNAEEQSPLIASAKRVQVDYSVSWLQWQLALTIDIDGLTLQSDSFEQPLYTLFPKTSHAPLFLRPFIDLKIKDGELLFREQKPIKFNLQGTYNGDWQASFTLLDSFQEKSPLELQVKRNIKSVKELSFSCHHCSLNLLELLGREFGLWWEAHIAQKGYLEGNFAISWDRRGPLSSHGLLFVHDLSLASPWQTEDVLHFPTLKFTIDSSNLEYEAASATLEMTSGSAITGSINGVALDALELKGELTFLRYSPRLRWNVALAGQSDGLHSSGEVLWRHKEGTVKVRVRGEMDSGLQLLFESSPNDLNVQLRQGNAAAWNTLYPIFLQVSQLPLHEVLLKEGQWSAGFKRLAQAEKSYYEGGLQVEKGSVELPGDAILLEGLETNLQLGLQKKPSRQGWKAKGEVAWESAAGAGLKAVGPLKSGSLTLFFEEQKPLQFMADLKGEDWQLSNHPSQELAGEEANRFQFKISTQRLKNLLPDPLIGYLSNGFTSWYEGYLTLSTIGKELLLETTCQLPFLAEVDPLLLRGSSRWLYKPENPVETGIKLGPWHLKNSQLSVALPEVIHPFEFSLNGFPIKLTAQGEINASYQFPDWQISYLLHSLTADHPLFQLTLPELKREDSLAWEMGGQSLVSAHHSSLFLPIREATLYIKPLQLTCEQLNCDIWGDHQLWFFSDCEGICQGFSFVGDALFYKGKEEAAPSLQLQMTTFKGEIKSIQHLLAAMQLPQLNVFQGLEGEIVSKDRGLNARFTFYPGHLEHEIACTALLQQGCYKQDRWLIKGVSTDLDLKMSPQESMLTCQSGQGLVSLPDLSLSYLLLLDLLQIPLKEGSVGAVDLSLLSPAGQMISELSGQTKRVGEELNVELHSRGQASENVSFPLFIQQAAFKMSSSGLTMFSGSAQFYLKALPQLISKFDNTFFNPLWSAASPIRLSWMYERLNDHLDLAFSSDSLRWGAREVAPLEMQISRQGDLWSLRNSRLGDVGCSADWMLQSDGIHVAYLELNWNDHLHLIGHGLLTWLSPLSELTIERLNIDSSYFFKQVSLVTIPFQHELTEQVNPLLLQGKGTFEPRNESIAFNFTLDSLSSTPFSTQLSFTLLADDSWLSEGVWKGSEALDWKWKATSSPTYQLLLFAPKEEKPLEMVFENKGDKILLNKMKGNLSPFEFNLSKIGEHNSNSWQGEIHLVASANHPLMPSHFRKLSQSWGIGKGWTLSGKWDNQGFSGTLSGKHCNFLGQRLALCKAQVVHTFPHLLLQQIELSDAASSVAIESLSLFPMPNQEWKIEIPHLLAKKLRFKYLSSLSPVFQELASVGSFKQLELYQIEGVTSQPDSWKTCGKCLFQIDSGSLLRHSLLQPFHIPGLTHAWESSLFIPVSGNVSFEIHSKKLHLRELKEVYSQGKLSKFSLAPNSLSSTISANGDLALYIRLKREGLFRKSSDTLFVDVTGTVNDPKIQFKKTTEETLSNTSKNN